MMHPGSTKALDQSATTTRRRVHPCLCFLCCVSLALLEFAAAFPAAQQKPSMGHWEAGAPELSGYQVDGKICLPIKRFTNESKYEMSISPNRRNVAVKVGSRIAVLFNGQSARIDKKPFELSMTPIEKNDDWYLPLDFYEAVYPVKFSYDEKGKLLTATLPGRTLRIPITHLKAPSPPPESSHGRGH